MPPPTLIFYHQNVLSGARNPVSLPSRHPTIASSLRASCFPSSGDSWPAFESALLSIPVFHKLNAGALAHALPNLWIRDSIDRNSFSDTATSAI